MWSVAARQRVLHRYLIVHRIEEVAEGGPTCGSESRDRRGCHHASNSQRVRLERAEVERDYRQARCAVWADVPPVSDRDALPVTTIYAFRLKMN
jgi:hypothetical protein